MHRGYAASRAFVASDLALTGTGRPAYRSAVDTARNTALALSLLMIGCGEAPAPAATDDAAAPRDIAVATDAGGIDVARPDDVRLPSPDAGKLRPPCLTPCPSPCRRHRPG